MLQEYDVDGKAPLNSVEVWKNEHQMQLLDERVYSFEDFKTIFGEVGSDNRFQCAEVKNTSNRMWVRLVGRRHRGSCPMP